MGRVAPSDPALLMQTIHGCVELGGALMTSVTSIGLAKCESAIAWLSPALSCVASGGNSPSGGGRVEHAPASRHSKIVGTLRMGRRYSIAGVDFKAGGLRRAWEQNARDRPAVDRALGGGPSEVDGAGLAD